MRLSRRRGQSTLEYLIVVAVIIAVIVVVATTVFRTNIESIFRRVATKPSNMLPTQSGNVIMLPEDPGAAE